MASEDEDVETTTFADRLDSWGSLHTRPRQLLPLLLFSPPLFLSTYVNLAGFPTGAAGISAAWSGLYALMALRRKPAGRSVATRFLSPRGLTRGAAIGLGVANAVAGGWVFLHGDWDRDEEERVKRNRWEE
ncbi:hypothetical protein GMORB2_4633 [Geosmithia morbida]|uniref:Uncharacterized protein n=1 Tax=Geosmithia morbida TaxID=1094350 RepID=A0A9P4YPS7_9HYPO|nr:uncharacterized protein GMORB2_4633 [Geosmithia morbida]KAF4119503.1 hypothetical protein GMORB2_4633 [Geosmithia morbida]